jgi:hypothetical protein
MTLHPNKAFRAYLLWTCAILGCLALALIAGAVFYKRYERSESADGVRYARGVIEAVGRDWDSGELSPRMSPALLAQTPPAQLKAFLERAHRDLGRLIALGPTQVLKVRTFVAGSGASTTVRTVTSCRFEKGEGYVRVTAVEKEGVWKVNDFFVKLPPPKEKG